MKNDALYRLTCETEKLRIYAADCSSSARELLSIHMANPHAGWLLAESLAAGLLLSATLKADSDQNLTFRFQGNGKVRQVIVQADARGNVRGYISDPHAFAEGGKNRIFAELIGPALLNITKDLGFGEPYTGVSPVLYGSVAKDTAYYLTSSEQVPSAIVIGTAFGDENISAAGGFLIQTFPDTPVASIEKIEAAITSAGESLSDHLKFGKGILEYVAALFGKSELKILSQSAVTLSCRCSRDLLAQTLARVDTAELRDMIEKDNGALTHCSFCKKEFRFTAQELQSFIDAKDEAGDNQIH